MRQIDLPFELWDEIAHFVGSTNDLLSLALVCRELSVIVLPHHIHYRRIRCNICKIDVWMHLDKYPHRARGIRSLEIVDGNEDNVQLPPIVRYTMPIGATSSSIIPSLLSSLSHMISLERFEWNPAPLVHMHDVSRLLVDRAMSLRALAIVFSFSQIVDECKHLLSSLPLWNLSNLTRVILSDIFDPAQHMLIYKCPNLEDLFLYASTTHCHCSAVLETATWPKLRRLTLRGHIILFPDHTTSSQKNTIAINFFRRHANLECLQVLSTSFPARPSRQDLSSLPDLTKLRSVYWDGKLTSKPSYFLFPSCLTRLVHYRVGSYEFDVALSMLSLKTLRFTFANWLPSKLPQFLENAPNLQKLSLEGLLMYSETKRLLPILTSTHIPNVTHLYFSALIFLEFDQIEQFVRDIRDLRSLRYLQVLFDRSVLYVEFVRDPDGKYSTHSFVTPSPSEVGPCPSEWGDYFEKL